MTSPPAPGAEEQLSISKTVELPILNPGHSHGTAMMLGRPTLKPPLKTRTFTGLDIGTTKVCAIIGEIDPTGKTTIKGIASTPSQGLRRGVVVDLDETVVSIRTAIQKAEEIAQMSVRDVFVGIAGGHIQCHLAQSTLETANLERGISKSDVRKVVDKAVASLASVDREIIQVAPQRFSIDDGPVADPIGYSSKHLSAEVLCVTAAVSSAQNIVRAVRQAGYRASGIYLEPMASSLAVLTPEEMDLGVVVVDIGGGTADIALWSQGAVRFTGSVPFGGDAITEDLRRGLKIGFRDAENLKKRHGTCFSDRVSPDEMLEVPLALTGEAQSVSRRFLCEIIESRMEEILEMAREACSSSRHYDSAYGGVVLTGGCALLDGIESLAVKVFQRPCKVGRPAGLSGLAAIAASPIYATGVGLVLSGLQHDHEMELGESQLFAKLVGFFKRAIDWY